MSEQGTTQDSSSISVRQSKVDQARARLDGDIRLLLGAIRPAAEDGKRRIARVRSGIAVLLAVLAALRFLRRQSKRRKQRATVRKNVKRHRKQAKQAKSAR